MRESTVRPLDPGVAADHETSSRALVVFRAVDGAVHRVFMDWDQKRLFLAFAAASAIHIPLGPGFSLLTVLAAVSLPVTLRTMQDRWSRLLTGATAAWLVGQLLSNAIREDGVRALAHQTWYPLMLAVMIPFGVLVASGGRRRGFVALAGMLAGHLVYNAFIAVGEPLSAAWKFRLAWPIIMLLLLAVDHLTTRPRQRMAPAFLALLLSAVSLAAGARLWAAVALAAALALLFLGRNSDMRRHLAVVTGMVALLVIAYVGFVQLATAGTLGGDLQYRVTRQGGLAPRAVLAARPEAVFSASLISSSPIIGFGGRPHFSEARISAGADLLRTLAGREDRHALTWVLRNGYNAHSLLLSFWVFAGLGAAVFWFTWVAFLLSGVARTVLSTATLSYLVLLAAPVALWDALFSPWAPHYEVVMCVVLVAVLLNRQGERA